MAQSSLEVSVVICAYTEDRWDDLVTAVESVRGQTAPPLEIIVVVDHNPSLMERVRVGLPGVVVVENHEPRGLGGARNSGVTAANGAVIAFLDDDAIAASDWLERLRAGYDDACDVIGVGGAIEPVWQGGRPEWFPEEFNWVVGGTYLGMPEATTAVRNLLGCNMSFRREVFNTIGNFRLGYGCDETEFCIRARQYWSDKTLLYNPQAKVFHQVRMSRATWRYFCSRCLFEGGSKAVVSRLLGAGDSLASERHYTFRTLPKGVLRGLSDAFLRGDVAGLGRVGAIIAGLVITTTGYLRGSMSIAHAAQARGWNGPITAGRYANRIGS